MCQQCLSSAEVVVGQIALFGVIVKQPVHNALARAGLVAPPDPVKRDHRTVLFLRALNLDPVEILGERVVAAADRWTPAVRVVRWPARVLPMVATA